MLWDSDTAPSQAGVWGAPAGSQSQGHPKRSQSCKWKVTWWGMQPPSCVGVAGPDPRSPSPPPKRKGGSPCLPALAPTPEVPPWSLRSVSPTFLPDLSLSEDREQAVGGEGGGEVHRVATKQKETHKGRLGPGDGLLAKISCFIKYRKAGWKKNNIHSLLQFQSRKPALISKNSYVM